MVNALETQTALEGAAGVQGESEEDSGGGLTFWETVINFVLNLIGAGVLVLPRTFATSGCVFALCLLATAFIVVMKCALITIANCTLAEAMSGTTVKSYEALCGEILGPMGKTALMFSKNSYFSGIIIVYSIMVTDSIGQWVPFVPRETIRWFVVLPIFGGLAMVKDLKQVAKLAPIGVIAAIVQCSSISLGSVIKIIENMAESANVPYTAYVPDFLAIGSVLATCAFGCGSIVATVPSVRCAMAEPKELPEALKYALGIVFSVYAGVSIIAYWAFGDDVTNNAMNSINKDCSLFQCFTGKVAALAIIMNLLISTPGVSFFVVSVVESLGTGPVFKPLSPPNIGARAVFILTMVLIGSLLPYVSEVVGLLSASFGCFNVLVLPSLINYRALERYKEAGIEHPVGNALEEGGKLSYAGVGVVAAIAMLFGIMGGITRLAAKMAAAGTITTTTTADVPSAIFAVLAA